MFFASLGFAASLVEEPAENQAYVKVIDYSTINPSLSRLGFIFLLMLVAQKVVDGLHWIEGAEGHFDEDGRPVAHGSIPKTW